MGNSSSSDPRFYHPKRGHLLTGFRTGYKGDLTYIGEFKDGWFEQGSMFWKDEKTPFGVGRFKFNEFYKGTVERHFNTILQMYVPEECVDQVKKYFSEAKVYLVGEYYIDDSGLFKPVLDKHCTIYYDRQFTKKFIDVDFDKGVMVSGSIMLNDEFNTIVASGEFKYDINSCVYVHSGMLCDDSFDDVLLIQEKSLYLKINPDESFANGKNYYNGYAEYYLDSGLKNLVVRCTLKEGLIHGNLVYYQNNRVVLCGEMYEGYFKKGIMSWYTGDYVKSDFDEDGNPHGIAEFYHDVDCKLLHASVNFNHGEYHGKYIEYDSAGKIIKTQIYHRDNLISESTDQIVITPDTSGEVNYERYMSGIGFLVHESELNNRCMDTHGTFVKWLENKLADKYWLNTLTKSKDSFFEECVNCEIEMLLDLTDKTSTKTSFTETFMKILQQPDVHMISRSFAELLIADIYGEFLKFCTASLHCKFISSSEYNELTYVCTSYIDLFRNLQNKYELEKWLDIQLRTDYNTIKSTVGNNILNIIKSRRSKYANDDNFASEIIFQLQNPLHSDLKTGRDKKMKIAYKNLVSMYHNSE